MPGIREEHPEASAESKQGTLSQPPPRPAGYVAPEEHDKRLDIADHLASLLKEQFEDPAASLAIVSAEAGRMMVGEEEDPAREVARARKGSGISGHEPSTGGAMSTHPAKLGEPHRSSNGFDRESATYGRLKPELLAAYEGKFVVVVGQEVLGPFDSFGEARWEGYQKFGLGPLYVKQVLAEEPVVHLIRYM